MSKITTGTLEPGIGEDNTIKVAGDLAVSGKAAVTENLAVTGNAEVQGNISIGGTMEQAALPMFACRGWARFDGTPTPIIIHGQAGGVISRVSTGLWRFTFDTPMPDTAYTICGNTGHHGSVSWDVGWFPEGTFQTTHFEFNTRNTAATLFNPEMCTVAVFR